MTSKVDDNSSSKTCKNVLSNLIKIQDITDIENNVDNDSDEEGEIPCVVEARVFEDSHELYSQRF